MVSRGNHRFDEILQQDFNVGVRHRTADCSRSLRLRDQVFQVGKSILDPVNCITH